MLQIGLKLGNGKFKPVDKLSHKLRFRFKNLVLNSNLIELPYYQELLKTM